MFAYYVDLLVSVMHAEGLIVNLLAITGCRGKLAVPQQVGEWILELAGSPYVKSKVLHQKCPCD